MKKRFARKKVLKSILLSFCIKNKTEYFSGILYKLEKAFKKLNK